MTICTFEWGSLCQWELLLESIACPSTSHVSYKPTRSNPPQLRGQPLSMVFSRARESQRNAIPKLKKANTVINARLLEAPTVQSLRVPTLRTEMGFEV